MSIAKYFLSAAFLATALDGTFAAEQPATDCIQDKVPCALMTEVKPDTTKVRGKEALGRIETNAAADTKTASARLAANQMQWQVSNASGGTVHFRLFSVTRRGWTWPGGTNAWVLPNDGRTYSVTITCNRGEQVVFGGALAPNYTTYWGAGINGDKSCTRCVAVCQGNVVNYGRLVR